MLKSLRIPSVKRSLVAGLVLFSAGFASASVRLPNGSYGVEVDPNGYGVEVDPNGCRFEAAG